MAPSHWLGCCSEHQTKSTVYTSKILGLIATTLVLAGYAPQIYHLATEQCSAGISIRAFVLWTLASLLFLIHATMIEDVVFICVQLINLAAGCAIVVLGRRYQGEVCPAHRA